MPDDPNPHIHNIRRDFDEYLFVERQEELKIARQWQNSNKRVLTITSPPANGKTWFLTHFQNLLDAENQITFKIDITKFLSDGPLGKCEINSTALQAYLSDFSNELQEKCGSVPVLDEEKEASSVLGTLAEYANLHCWPDQPIYLFVDGGDEPSLAAWETIEKEILEPIIAHSNWQLIIALRKSQRLYSYRLRKTEQRCPLPPLPAPIKKSKQGQEQLKKLINQSKEPTPKLNDILNMVPDYNWVHLGLNYFLFMEACYQYKNKQKLAGNDLLLKRGIMALTQLHKIDTIVNQLQSISQLLPEWSVDELAERLGQPLSDTWKTIQILQEHMLITNINNRYQITPGIQEFVRSLTPIYLATRIDRDINDFIEKNFLFDLSSALAVTAERIEIEEKRDNLSVKMPKEYFEALLQMYIEQDSRLEKLGLLELEHIDKYGVPLPEKIQEGVSAENNKRQYRQNLRRLMENQFSLDELLTLCFDESIDYENFEKKKNPIVIEIIRLYERNRHLSELLSCLRKTKPNVVWPTID